MKQPVFHGKSPAVFFFSLGVRSPQAYSHVPGRLESSTQQFVSRQRSRPCEEEVGGLGLQDLDVDVEPAMENSHGSRRRLLLIRILLII